MSILEKTKAVARKITGRREQPPAPDAASATATYQAVRGLTFNSADQGFAWFKDSASRLEGGVSYPTSVVSRMAGDIEAAMAWFDSLKGKNGRPLPPATPINITLRDADGSDVEETIVLGRIRNELKAARTQFEDAARALEINARPAQKGSAPAFAYQQG